jgi:hypothetical protein
VVHGCRQLAGRAAQAERGETVNIRRKAIIVSFTSGKGHFDDNDKSGFR